MSQHFLLYVFFFAKFFSVLETFSFHIFFLVIIQLSLLINFFFKYQILYERKGLSEKTMQLLNTSLASVSKEALASESEFWSAGKTLSTLAEGGYFSSEASGVNWPEGLKQFLNAGMKNKQSIN